jgi:ABC-2 type transport system permease protein
MSQATNAIADPAKAPPVIADRPIPPRGWLVVAAKELGDHLSSARFVVLLLVLALAAGIPIWLAADRLQQLNAEISGARGVFIALFFIGPQDTSSIFQIDVTVQSFIAIAAPLLGIAFAFDAVNGERSQGTLPRLVSQPIYRDDVINGKFAGALAVIALVLVFVVSLIAAFGIIRLGIVPALSEVVRLLLWLVLTIVYVGLWLAFAMLISVVIRRAATSALVGLGTWLLLVVFGRFLVNLFVRVFLPVPANGTVQQQITTAQAQDLVNRLLPTTLYAEASTVLLNPGEKTSGTLSSLGQYQQQLQQIPSLLALDQSVLLVWPHMVALVAITVALFAIAYIMFMRQEVRA